MESINTRNHCYKIWNQIIPNRFLLNKFHFCFNIYKKGTMTGLGLSYVLSISEIGNFYLCTWDSEKYKEIGNQSSIKDFSTFREIIS